MKNELYIMHQYGHVEIHLKEHMDKQQITRNALARAVNTRFEVIDKWYNGHVEKTPQTAKSDHLRCLFISYIVQSPYSIINVALENPHTVCYSNIMKQNSVCFYFYTVNISSILFALR